MFGEAFAAGFWASAGSILGKLTGGLELVGYNYFIYGGLLLAMVLANTWGCRYYVRSLDASGSSVMPTVVSAAVNYILSGFIGIIFFGEAWTARWWMGAALITAGLALMTSPEKKHSE